MSYVDDARQALTDELARRGSECAPELVDLYTLLVLTCGTYVDLEDVHDAWAVWTAARRPDRRSLIPFDDLAADVQQLGSADRDAIRAAAEQVNPAAPSPTSGTISVRIQVGDAAAADVGELPFEAGDTGDDLAARLPAFLRAAADQYESAPGG